MQELMQEVRGWGHKTAHVFVLAALVGTGLSGCATDGGSDKEAKPTITDPTELVDGTAIKFEDGEPYEAQHLEATQGQFLFLAVNSDIAGQLDLEGDESVRQSVKPGKVATVVVNAAENGEFDLTLRHGDEVTVLATVEVGE